MADNSIALQIQTPNSFETLGNALRTGAAMLELKKAKETLPSDIQIKKETAKQSEIKTNLDRFKLTGEYAQKARDISQSLVSDPDVINGNQPAIISKIGQAKQMMIDSGIPQDIAEVQAAHLITAAASDPKSIRQILLNSIQAGVGSSGQAANIQPQGIATNSGQQTQVVQTNPLAGETGVPIKGTFTQQVLPPTTPVFNPITNTPGYLGPQPQLNGQVPGVSGTGFVGDAGKIIAQIVNDPKISAQDKQDALIQLSNQIAGQGKQSQIQSGPALGQAENIAGTVDTVNKDWQSTAESAKTASQDIGVLQNIKKYAQGAITGVEADRRSYLAGLAGLLGMDEAQLAKTNTDVLAKNSAMLALAGGDTNLAKTLAESANPNTKMTKEAITDAANQVIAQRKLVLAKQRYLQPFKSLNDPESYSKALSQFNQVADPRILQLNDMSDSEIAKMKAAMSPSERDDFKRKIIRMQELGILNE